MENRAVLELDVFLGAQEWRKFVDVMSALQPKRVARPVTNNPPECCRNRGDFTILGSSEFNVFTRTVLAQNFTTDDYCTHAAISSTLLTSVFTAVPSIVRQ
jgi:hypothetical protein